MAPVRKALPILAAGFPGGSHGRCKTPPGNGGPFLGLTQAQLAFLPPPSTTTTNEALANPTVASKVRSFLASWNFLPAASALVCVLSVWSASQQEYFIRCWEVARET